jgi:hypothetical protein
VRRIAAVNTRLAIEYLVANNLGFQIKQAIADVTGSSGAFSTPSVKAAMVFLVISRVF